MGEYGAEAAGVLCGALCVTGCIAGCMIDGVTPVFDAVGITASATVDESA